jgi:hypothetical protein
MILQSNLKTFFQKELNSLNCDIKTKSYILTILTDYNPENNYSNESLTLIYAKAKHTQDFVIFQNLGDWLFFCHSVFPDCLNNASSEYYQSIARLSYYSCFRLINKKWLIFENLADDYDYLTTSTRKIFKRLQPLNI